MKKVNFDPSGVDNYDLYNGLMYFDRAAVNTLRKVEASLRLKH